jgi:hypothetical protein
MIPLISKPNVISPSSTYPYGAIKDNPGDGSGTPVNALVYGDFHQFFAKLFSSSGLTANEIVDNATNGFQLFEALWMFGNANFVTDLIRGLLGNYTANDLIILWGCNVTANIGGTSSITQGAIYYNDIVYKVPAIASISSPSQTLVFKISGLDLQTITLVNGISGSGVADYNSATVKYSLAGLPSYKTSGGATSLIPQLRTKIFEIGDWDMNANSNVSVAHDISNTGKIRRVSVIIRNDAVGAGVFDLSYWNIATSQPNGGIAAISTSTIALCRLTGGDFDATIFNSTSYNRGWITVEYEF